MLTEGWDCNTVTHILGVRAFGTRLLCEQVMGRGLRRRSYTVGDDGKLTPEYADIFGVPFSGFPVAGLGTDALVSIIGGSGALPHSPFGVVSFTVR